MNNHYYNQLCTCDVPLPSIHPDRCYICGGIVPRWYKHQRRALMERSDGSPTNGALWVVVLTLVVLLALWAITRITLIASQHDPNPPAFSTHYEGEEVRP
jgi:hypothetical protein